MKAFTKNTSNKRRVREILKTLPHKFIIGLAGPNIKEYIEFFSNKKIIIYENNKNVFLKQVRENLNSKLIYDDILNSPIMDDTFYDFDFCCHLTAKKLNQIEEYPEYYAAFSLIKRDFKKIFDLILTVINSKLKLKTPTGYIIIKKDYTYHIGQYWDTSSMIYIFKTKTKLNVLK